MSAASCRQGNSLVVLCEDRGASLFASSKTMFQWAADVENLNNLQEEHCERVSRSAIVKVHESDPSCLGAWDSYTHGEQSC